MYCDGLLKFYQEHDGLVLVDVILLVPGINVLLVLVLMVALAV